MTKRFLRAAVVSLALVAGVGGAAAQEPPPAAQPQGRIGPDLAPAEVQRLFDAYAIVQAQEMLTLTDAQYAQFLTRLKALQEMRRRNQQARNTILLDLRRMTQPGVPADEPTIRERLRMLYDLDARAAADLRKGYEAIDQVLDVRQQARFRVLEERLERQKLELLLRARQGQRPQVPGRRLPQRPPAM